eukprot:1390255-Amorphochlora_amoeboformis.AAC.2
MPSLAKDPWKALGKGHARQINQESLLSSWLLANEGARLSHAAWLSDRPRSFKGLRSRILARWQPTDTLASRRSRLRTSTRPMPPVRLAGPSA